MAPWPLQHIVSLILFSMSNGQMNHFRGFSGRFKELSPDSYFRLHENNEDRVIKAPRFTLLAPDLLRADSQENIYLEASGVSGPITVHVTILDFRKTSRLFQDNVILSQENGYCKLSSIHLSSDGLDRDENKNKFVFLKAEFDGHVIERVMMVTFHSGYIFIQTDKPVYNPGDKVYCRAYVSTPSFKAFNSTIIVEFQNAEGIVVKQSSRVRAMGGVFAETMSLSELVKEGIWRVVARFDHWKQNTFSSQFEVKRYVLPAFNVTLTPKTASLSLDDTELEVEISARYLYGEPVQGTAYVVFGIEINKEMRRLPAVKQVSDLDAGVAKLTMEEITRVYPNLRSLVGSSVYVKASVLTKSGSDLVEAQKTGIKIVESPYIISFSNPPKYFKPGLPFDLTIQVSHHDGSLARDIFVKLNVLDSPLLIASGTYRVAINMPQGLQHQVIIAETAQPHLKPEQQAKQQIIVYPYQPFNQNNQNFLYISTGTGVVSVGERLSLTLTISAADTNRALITHITYLVLTKGNIITAEQLNVVGQSATTVGLTVTAEMMPSFRFVAYYTLAWERREEVVADSVWVDVRDKCIGGLSVGPVDGRHRVYRPGTAFKFQLKGDPGAKVNLVAVDNAVYLLSLQRLTQRKMWDTVETGDIGCTHGGGSNGLQVFTDAGLFFGSSTGVQTSTRQALQCPGYARKRRSAELLKRRAQLESHYKEKLMHRCCKDGLRDIPMPYSCTRRSLYITEGWECIRAFRYCCAHYRHQEFDTQRPTTMPPLTTTTTLPPTTSARVVIHMVHRQKVFMMSRPGLMGQPGPPGESGGAGNPEVYRVLESEASIPKAAGARVIATENEDEEEDDGEYLDETQVYLRSKFYESWLWNDKYLPKAKGTDGLASLTVDSILPDSITEWGILAISASPDTGFCVAEPYNIKTWKHFFVDLKLPYSVARNEQIEIKAVIHNYGDLDMQVRVVLMKTEGICSVAFNEKHTQEFQLAAGSSLVVPYTIVPLVVGKLPLEVMVVGRDQGGDRVQKMLRVVMEGVQKTQVQSFVLNPSSSEAGGRQVIRVEKVLLDSVVPNSQPETFINIRGNLLADSIENSISDDSLASLIRMPGGCVEQNLASMILPLTATLYLDITNNWESVGVERRAEALRYIRRGYENQLAYRKSDGSYPPYSKQGTSTWITAFVVKVLAMAHSIVGVNEQQVCEPLLYLLKNTQQPLGNFKEDTPVYSKTITGGVYGNDPEVTLTAFVLIALVEAQQAGIKCTDTAVDVEVGIQKAASHLRRGLQSSSKKPYTVAISAYALALLGKEPDAEVTRTLLSAASSDGSHWPDGESRLFSIEATGYALLALVKSGRIGEATAPFNWLNTQRRIGGGFGSTQPTVVVLQALSQYLIQRPPPSALRLLVDVKVPGRGDLRYHFDPRTSYMARSSKVPLDQVFEVQAEGNGEGILEVVTYYNQLHEAEENIACQHFELTVAIEESTEKAPADVERSYQITIKVRALGPRDVRMVVLDISLPTGFTPDNSDLEMLSNSVDHYISSFKIVDNLSDRGSLIVHLFKVSHKEPEILIFKLHQNFKVGLLQPSPVTVYEYYNPEHRCSHAYTPPEDKKALAQICTENVCRCTQGDCCIPKTDTQVFSDQARETFACQSLHHVFKVKVLNVIQRYYDKYEVEITQAIKLGVESGVSVGQRRLFMSHGICREGLSLQVGSEYLIIGPRQDMWNIDRTSNRFIYMLGKNTWVERWPSPHECSSSSSLLAKCTTMQDAATELSVTGCRL